MTDFEKHIPYFSTIYSLYQSASSSAKTEVLKSLINYGNFPAFIYYLNKIWFQSSVTPKIATENMEFLMLYFEQANNMHVDIDYGQLSELAQFLIRIFYQKAQPKNFKNYEEFLLHIFEKVKALEANSIFDVLIKCPFESALFPLSIFGVVNSNYNSKAFKLLFSLYSTAFQKEESKNIWIESFVVLLSNKIQKYDHYSPKVIDKIKNLLSDSSIISDKKLKILYTCTNSLRQDEVIELYKKFYGVLLRNISPKTTPEGISYIFKVSTEYYKILIPQNKDNKDENGKKNIELVLDPLFSSALPFFFYSSEVEKSAVDFCKLIESNILQQYITSIVEDPLFIRASLFFVSHFPTEKTIQVLFKPINNQIYLNAQREAIIYFLSHFACPPHQLSIAFALLKASDFEENESIDKIIDTNPVLYCSSVIKYITFCIDGIEKVIHFSDIFLKKKTIPIVPAPKYLNHSVLTLSVHFFGYKKHVKSISALISYLKACKENSNSDKEKNPKNFDYFSGFNDETHIWPNFVHEALTSDDEWREDLCNLSLQRLGKQEFQQCIVLAAISKDPMILHNSALLLLKDSKMIPVLFTASATNWEKETLNEIKNIVNEYSKDQQVESKRGFFSSLFSRSSSNESSYKPKIDVFPIVLNLIPAITQVLPFSSSLFDLLFTVFPSDQKPQYMTLTCKAIYSVCNLITKDKRLIIHSIIDRLCNSNLSLCDISVFEQTLIKSLSVNQSMTEELALKISSLYISLVLKKQISDNSLFEETFLNDYYGELTLNAFTKVLLSQIAKNDDNEQIFGSFYRMLKKSSAKNVSYFQRFDHVLISNLFSNNNFIRKVCFKSLNLIEKMNFSQEEIDKISKISSTDPNISNESLLYFRLNLSKSFIDCLAKKFTYKSSLILIEILLHHFIQVSYNNQVSIANFINATLNLYADKYLDEKNEDAEDETKNNSLLVSLFKQIRKIEISNFKCLNNEYIDIIVRLAKVKSKKFVPLLLEQTTMQILNESHLTALCNVDSFIPLFIEAVLDLIKTKENLTVEVISRASQILGILIDQRDAFDFKYHDDYVILFIALTCLTSASLPKWTTSFKAQHFKNLSSIFAKFASLTNEETSKFTENFLNNMNEGGVVVFSEAAQFKLHFNLLKVIQMLLERTRIESSAFDKLNDTVFFFLKYFCIAIKMKISNSNEDFESQFNILINEFENKVFVNEYLPSILFYLSDCFTIERLKDLRKNKKEIFLMIFMSLVSFFENYSKNTKVNSFSQTAQTITKDESLTAIKKKISPLYVSLSPSLLSNSTVRYNSILFMRIVLVMEKKYIKAKINEILKTMNIFVLYDPNVLSLVEFSASLFKIIKTESDPSYFITNFNIIIIKMSSSIFSHRTESRQISCYFLSHLLKPEPKPNDPSKNENDNNNINSDENINANNDENIDVISYSSAEQIDFKSLFSNLSSSYDQIDKNQKRYVELAKSVLNVASSEFEIHQQNKEKTSLEDIERLAAVMLPLCKKENESKSTEQEVISRFIEFLKTVASSSDLDVLNPIINMITEFTSLF